MGEVGLAELSPALRKAEKRLGREVNVTNYSADEFRKKVAEGDHFLTTVLKSSLQFLKGEQREFKAISDAVPCADSAPRDGTSRRAGNSI